jgi:hypothetical protein
MSSIGKMTGVAACAVAASMALAACAAGGGGYAGGFGPAPGYDVWYDGYYGDIDGGYWGPDAFYYHGPDGRFIRDGGNHFHHQSFSGGRGMRSGRPPV